MFSLRAVCNGALFFHGAQKCFPSQIFVVFCLRAVCSLSCCFAFVRCAAARLRLHAWCFVAVRYAVMFWDVLNLHAVHWCFAIACEHGDLHPHGGHLAMVLCSFCPRICARCLLSHGELWCFAFAWCRKVFSQMHRVIFSHSAQSCLPFAQCAVFASVHHGLSHGVQ